MATRTFALSGSGRLTTQGRLDRPFKPLAALSSPDYDRASFSEATALAVTPATFSFGDRPVASVEASALLFKREELNLVPHAPSLAATAKGLRRAEAAPNPIKVRKCEETQTLAIYKKVQTREKLLQSRMSNVNLI